MQKQKRQTMKDKCINEIIFAINMILKSKMMSLLYMKH